MSGFLTRDRALLVVVLLVGIVGSGVTRWALGQAGYDALGTVLWILGYGGMVLVLWYGWIRPLDIRGPLADEEAD